MTDDQRKLRLGVMLTVAAVAGLALVAPTLFQRPWGIASIAPLVAIALMTFAGVGLIRVGAPWTSGGRREGPASRWAGVLLFAALGLGTIWQFGRLLFAYLGQASSLLPVHWMALANACGASLLIIWLSWRAVALLAGWRFTDPRRGPRLTSIWVGLALIASSVNHLWVATQTADWTAGGFAVSLSPSGLSMYGFFGWPIWHGATLVAALVLVSGWRTGQRCAAFALSGVWVLAIPLILMLRMVWAESPFGLSLLLIGGFLPLLMATLSWWLAQELRDPSDPVPVSNTNRV